MVVPREYRPSNAPLTCLGRPSHVVEPEKILCHICGSFVQGAVIGTYQVLELLGVGRSGRAYRAMYVRRQQAVTLKLYPFDAASMHSWSEAQQEMNRVRQLNHPFILPVQSSSLWRPKPNASLQNMSSDMYKREISGEESFMLILCNHAPASLSQFLAMMSNRGMAGQAVTDLQLFIEQAANALGTAHRQGLMHGSLVPGNFLLENPQHLRIADFGLAHLHPPPAPYLAPELVPYVRQTAHGDEWIQLGVVTPASDQYAFAVLCWQWLTAFMSINAAVTTVLQQAMQPNPGARFATIDEFVSNLLVQVQHNVSQARIPGIGQRRDTPRSFPRSTLSSSGIPEAGASRDAMGTSQRNERTLPTNPTLPTLPATPPPVSWIRRGDSSFAEHRYEDAIYAYKHVLDEDKRNSTVWIALGDAYFALEQYTDALHAYDEAIRLNGNDATAWFNRGTVLEAMGRRAEADICYARANVLNGG